MATVGEAVVKVKADTSELEESFASIRTAGLHPFLVWTRILEVVMLTAIFIKLP